MEVNVIPEQNRDLASQLVNHYNTLRADIVHCVGRYYRASGLLAATIVSIRIGSEALAKTMPETSHHRKAHPESQELKYLPREGAAGRVHRAPEAREGTPEAQGISHRVSPCPECGGGIHGVDVLLSYQ